MSLPLLSNLQSSPKSQSPANDAYRTHAQTASDRRGRLIVLEGLDGTGKTTLSLKLAAALEAEWATTPGALIRGGGLRELADQAFTYGQARQLFYAAAVVQESARIEEVLQQGRTVVVDRWWLTTWAYGQLYSDGLHLREVEDLVLPADVTIWVELPESERRRRLLARGMTDADQLTLRPSLAARLKGLFRQGLRRPIAGQTLRLDVTATSPDLVCARALAGLRELSESAPAPVRRFAQAAS